ncbi:MAG: hypothetical protein JOY90_38330 [Bradyrhizobium sp.]|nr:hypothetical protein [Bradyrhizobium sp.]
MSDGHYCLVRDLGPVKGGKGLRHHEVVVDFSYRGFKDLSKRGATALLGRLSAKRQRRRATEPVPDAEALDAVTAELANLVRELDAATDKPSRKTRAA